MIFLTKKQIVEQFAAKNDKKISYRSLKYSDLDKIAKFVPENFHRLSGMNQHVLRISLGFSNLDNSFVAIIDNEIAGCIFLGDKQMPTPSDPEVKGLRLNKSGFLPNDYQKLSEMEGMEIVLLSVNEKYRGYNVGLGLLRHVIKNIDTDYLWGGQMSDLENQAFWDRFSVLFYKSPNLNMNYRILKK